MAFPEKPTPLRIYNYLMEDLVKERKFLPENFLHVFSLVFAISKVKRNKYGAVFVGFPGINTYFGDVTPEDSFSVGFKIYTPEEEETSIPVSQKDLFLVGDKILIIFGNNLYRTNLSEIAILHYLIKNRDTLDFSKAIEVKKADVYQDIDDLLEYGGKLVAVIKQQEDHCETAPEEATTPATLGGRAGETATHRDIHQQSDENEDDKDNEEDSDTEEDNGKQALGETKAEHDGVKELADSESDHSKSVSVESDSAEELATEERESDDDSDSEEAAWPPTFPVSSSPQSTPSAASNIKAEVAEEISHLA